MMIDPIALFVLLLGAATPILFAALGELVVERAGVLNLGVEGMMIGGAGEPARDALAEAKAHLPAMAFH